MSNIVEKLATELGWSFLEEGAASPLGTKELLVVLAPQWSAPDLEQLRSVASRVPPTVGKVMITDIDYLGPASYGKLLPGSPIVIQTPVVALYRDGVLGALWSGPAQIASFPHAGTRWPTAPNWPEPPQND